jgi:hypothetical protein
MIATTRGRRRNGRRKDAEPVEPHLEVWKRGCWTQGGGCGALYFQVPGSANVMQADYGFRALLSICRHGSKIITRAISFGR